MSKRTLGKCECPCSVVETENEKLRQQNASMLEALRMLVNLNRSKDPVEAGIVHDASAILASIDGAAIAGPVGGGK